MSAETAEKRRPMVERIAGLDVKSSFRDIREGFGGTTGVKVTDQDIAAALGVVKTRCGKLAAYVLETYYGSILLHEHRLRAAWAEYSETPADPAADRIRNRVAAALAIREFAGAANPTSLLAEWGLIADEPEERLRKRVRNTLAWLEGVRGEAYREFVRAVGRRD
jgi:hypothetical protein